MKVEFYGGPMDGRIEEVPSPVAMWFPYATKTATENDGEITLVHQYKRFKTKKGIIYRHEKVSQP